MKGRRTTTSTGSHLQQLLLQQQLVFGLTTGSSVKSSSGQELWRLTPPQQPASMCDARPK